LDDLSREVFGDVFDVDDGDIFLDDGDVFFDDGDVLVDDGDVLVDLVKDPGDDDDALLIGGGDGRLLPLPLPLPCFAPANPSNLFCSFLLLFDSSISTSRNTLLGVSSSITLRPPLYTDVSIPSMTSRPCISFTNVCTMAASSRHTGLPSTRSDMRPRNCTMSVKLSMTSIRLSPMSKTSMTGEIFNKKVKRYSKIFHVARK
jgi:hypothetical protein